MRFLPLKHGNWVDKRFSNSWYVMKQIARQTMMLELDIMGCDIDGRMVEIAKANARGGRD